MMLTVLFLPALNAEPDDNKADKVLTATFAGGCFWCTEADFEKVEGVIEVVSGYMGGTGANPTYKTYISKGHIEVVQIKYDATRVSYGKLLEVLWRKINPTDPGGQFVDRGRGYISAIFYHNEEQRELAEASKRKLAESGVFEEPIVTELLEATTFYPAEEYHQDYYKKNPVRYWYYRKNSGRDQFLKKIWDK